MTAPDELLVVGGGIGGLATALAVARAGRPVRVLEREPEFGEIGAGLQLAPNATRLLDGLGVLERVIEAGVLPRRLVFMDALDGSELTSLPLDADFRARFGGPYVVLHRSDLLRILLEGCREAGVILETAATVVGVTSLPDRAEVRCGDGSTRTGSAVIGADGLHSELRRLLCEDEPVFSGYVAYRGTLPIEQMERHADLSDVVAWIGPGMHLVQYRLHPLGPGAMYNQVAVFRSARYAAGLPDWGGPDELDAAFGDACDQVTEALPRLWRDRHWPMHDREPIDTWVDGRLALLGDAAHPMLQYLAQGACQALEDAACLAERVTAHPPDRVGQGLLDYQDTRVPHATRVQRTARLWGDIWHVDGVGRTLRNELFRTRDAHDHRHVDWLYGTPSTARDA